MKRHLWIALSAILFFTPTAQAKLKVVTTTPDLRVLASEIGGDFIEVESIAKGTQDYHYIEAKPSYMLKINKADLVISVGLDLEVGWLPSILQGARNPKVNPGSQGYLEAGSLVRRLEVPTGNITRADGDVHPAGNPHYSLDPIAMGSVAVGIADRLAEMDPRHGAYYREKGQSIQVRFTKKSAAWLERLKKSKITQIITYHKTFSYFFERFQIANPAILEPKPGIPPTAAHVLEVIGLMKTHKISLVLVENYFDATIGKRIQDEVPGARIASVPVAVEGASEVKNLDDLYEKLVSVIEGKNP
ncbi:metal ABC transporter substrate-binding protein [bacterium]|nr:metal ABC transporter substrate-binding protein [bacterium]